MNITDAKELIHAAILVEDSVLLSGPAGIGKSQTVKQIANELNYHYVDLRLANNEVGDLIGIPKIIEKDGRFVTTWAMPNWLDEVIEQSKKGVQSIICLEELNRAPEDVRQCALQLVLDKQIHEHYLPNVNGVKTHIIACINEGDEYQVEELDEALMDRFTYIELEPDLKSFVNWAKQNKVQQSVIDFLSEDETRLLYKPTSGIGSSPRSWSKVSEYLDIAAKISSKTLSNVLIGKLGKELGSQFYVFLENYKSNITPKQVYEKVKSLASQNDDADIQIIANELKEYLKDLETIQLKNLTKNVMKCYIKEDIFTVLTTLYSLNIEILASLLTEFKTDYVEEFKTIVIVDEKFYNKQLFKKLTQI